MAVMQSRRTHDQATQMENLCRELSRAWMRRGQYQSYIAHPNYQPPWIPLSIGSCAVFLNLLGQLHFYNEKLIPKSKENENRQRFFWMLTNLAIILEMIWGDELWTTVQSCNLSIFSRIQIRQRHSVITIFFQIYKEFSKITPSRSLQQWISPNKCHTILQ